MGIAKWESSVLRPGSWRSIQAEKVQDGPWGPPSSEVWGPGQKGEKVSGGPGPSLVAARMKSLGLETRTLDSADGWLSVTLRSHSETHSSSHAPGFSPAPGMQRTLS